jgi:anti-sigma-K factor RskA
MADDTDIDGLAAEYVLGALEPEERRAVTDRLAREPRLAVAVAEWERLLSPLGWGAPGVEANANALSGILATIMRGRDDATRTAEVVALRRRARTWQRLATGLAATLAAIAIGVGVVGRDILGDRGSEIAVLASIPGSATADEPAGGISVAFVASYDAKLGRLAMRRVAGRPATAGRAFVAWLEPPAGVPPKLLGSLRRDDAPTYIDLTMAPADLSLSRLIVSLEQDRTTVMDRPRGPIVSAGSFSRP